MLTIHNKTPGDIGIDPETRVPAMGSLEVDDAVFASAMNNPMIEARINSGELVATGYDRKTPKTKTAPAPVEPDPEPDEASEPDATEASEEDQHKALIAEAQELGIKVNPRWKPETIAKKIAAAKG